MKYKNILIKLLEVLLAILSGFGGGIASTMI